MQNLSFLTSCRYDKINHFNFSINTFVIFMFFIYYIVQQKCKNMSKTFNITV